MPILLRFALFIGMAAFVVVAIVLVIAQPEFLVFAVFAAFLAATTFGIPAYARRCERKKRAQQMREREGGYFLPEGNKRAASDVSRGR